jgi:MYXO-CTERM domain-containing protein
MRASSHEPARPASRARFSAAVVCALFASIIGVGAASADAAPFLTVTLLGRITGSGQPFSNTVVVTSTSQTVDYAVQFQLAPSGTNNAFSPNRTIGTWIPSTPAPDPGDPTINPTSGLNSLRFSLSQTASAPGVKATFTQTAAAGTTNNGSWVAGTGAKNGTLTARGDGATDLIDVAFIRAAGTFDGIDTSSNPVVVTVNNTSSTKSRFAVQSLGTGPGVVSIGLKGLTTVDLFTGMRWQPNSVSTTLDVGEQNSAVAAGNPLIVFNGLTLVPEPNGASVGIAGVAALGAAGLRRRRR